MKKKCAGCGLHMLCWSTTAIPVTGNILGAASARKGGKNPLLEMYPQTYPLITVSESVFHCILRAFSFQLTVLVFLILKKKTGGFSSCFSLTLYWLFQVNSQEKFNNLIKINKLSKDTIICMNH